MFDGIFQINPTDPADTLKLILIVERDHETYP